jgi:hypothetical protein
LPKARSTQKNSKNARNYWPTKRDKAGARDTCCSIVHEVKYWMRVSSSFARSLLFAAYAIVRIAAARARAAKAHFVPHLDCSFQSRRRYGLKFGGFRTLNDRKREICRTAARAALQARKNAASAKRQIRRSAMSRVADLGEGRSEGPVPTQNYEYCSSGRGRLWARTSPFHHLY